MVNDLKCITLETFSFLLDFLYFKYMIVIFNGYEMKN